MVVVDTVLVVPMLVVRSLVAEVVKAEVRQRNVVKPSHKAGERREECIFAEIA